MYLKKSSISKAMIVLLVLMHLCYFLILFGGTSLFADSFIPKTRMMLFLGMMVIAIVCMPLYKTPYMWFELSILAVVWIRGWIGASADGYAWDDTLALLRPYLYPLLVLPIYALLQEEEWNFKSFLKFIVITVTIDTIIRGIDSIAENLTGSLLWSNLVVGEMGYRNDIYRINPSGLDILIIPLTFYLYSKADTRKERYQWILCLLINLLYTIIIWQGRAPIIYKIALLVFLLYMQRTEGNVKIVRVSIGMIAALILVNTPFLGNYLGTLSTTNPETGGSTLYRLNALNYFMNMYSDNMFFGVGLLSTEERYAPGGGVLGDIGLVWGLVQFGIPMMIFYAAIFIRGFYVCFRVRRVMQEEALLILSMTLLILIFNINIDTFYMFAFAVPFYIAITEYVYSKSQIAYEDVDEVRGVAE